MSSSNNMQRTIFVETDATVDDAVLRKKEQKDVELDKKITALRKKNEALMRRYQEIEEDRKRAEQEGMAVTSRRARPEGLTITITKAHHEKRVVSEKWGTSCPSASNVGIGSEEEEDEEEADHLFTFRMGKRVQLAVTMDNKAKGKRLVSEKRASDCLVNPAGAPEISEEEMDQLVAFRRGRRMQIAITMDNKDRVNEKRTVERRWSEGDKYSENALIRKERGKSPLMKSPGDKGCNLMGRERSEYMRWKKERDQIDLERLARHKNARGEWRRAWDIEKSEYMFEDIKDGEPALDCPHSKKGARNPRKSQHRSLPSEGKGGGQHRRSTGESASRTLPVMSSKARGKDRLTGRARRWDAKEGEEMHLAKDDHNNQKSSSNENLKSQAMACEEAKKHNCLAGLEKNEKPHSTSQVKIGGVSPSAGEDKGANEQDRMCLPQDTPAVAVEETEADPSLSKAVTGTALSHKGNCINSRSHQEGNTAQASGSAFEEINSTFHEAGLDKKALSERNPSAENLSTLPVKAEAGGGSRGLSAVRQVGEIQIAAVKKQIIPVKENDAPACLLHREESKSLSKEMLDRMNESVQTGTEMRNKEQGQPQPCNEETQN
ncbi:coiled-coil domain-containing protein 9B isoform X1 [Varanus komodoensis]|uniref:Coiled-coil domain containing 9B n=1 Tax=Varanus komodoensis TaxID=61221 RepID=A0A8D2L5Y2_VARKO|nr:coiled-coil domain-containing protein 9B isoform X1 [Varanus komodoensis]XP_044292268.1 coiled-coil domain-containing protein 9B isoform X1 [Varanus komodoensis]XP_044292269.1 coiled-coil domain-containing protein 9B isoform X1 [Varanus komodoensis]XP_044292270.1 coiled-coil domain-containing protein 9B isoform X1 [Varanus komodoensis]